MRKYFISLVIFLAGCGHNDYQQKLNANVTLEVIGSSEVFVSSSVLSISVGPMVEKIAVVGDYILGTCKANERPDPCKTGFFIFDSANGEVQEGLTEEEYLNWFAQKKMTPPTLVWWNELPGAKIYY
jgi:hypothetical protein